MEADFEIEKTWNKSTNFHWVYEFNAVSALAESGNENHWSQWLPSTIPFNGDGNYENHWNFAMVAKEYAKSPTNATINFKSLNTVFQGLFTPNIYK